MQLSFFLYKKTHQEDGLSYLILLRRGCVLSTRLNPKKLQRKKPPRKTPPIINAAVIINPLMFQDIVHIL